MAESQSRSEHAQLLKDVQAELSRLAVGHPAWPILSRCATALSEQREPTPIGLFWQTTDGKWHFNAGVFRRSDIHDNGRPMHIAYMGEALSAERNWSAE